MQYYLVYYKVVPGQRVWDSRGRVLLSSGIPPGFQLPVWDCEGLPKVLH